MEVPYDVQLTHKATIKGVPLQPEEPDEVASKGYVDGHSSTDKVVVISDNQTRTIRPDDDKTLFVANASDLLFVFPINSDLGGDSKKFKTGTRVMIYPKGALSVGIKGPIDPAIPHNRVKGTGVSLGFIYLEDNANPDQDMWLSLGGIVFEDIVTVPRAGEVRLLAYPVNADADGLYADPDGLLWLIPDSLDSEMSIGPEDSDATVKSDRLERLYSVLARGHVTMKDGEDPTNGDKDWRAKRAMIVPNFNKTMIGFDRAEAGTVSTSMHGSKTGAVPVTNVVVMLSLGEKR